VSEPKAGEVGKGRDDRQDRKKGDAHPGSINWMVAGRGKKRANEGTQFTKGSILRNGMSPEQMAQGTLHRSLKHKRGKPSTGSGAEDQTRAKKNGAEEKLTFACEGPIKR